MDVLWLALAAFAAGFIDAVAGGGGLIQVPALMAVFPRELPPVLFGTNKAASVWGSLNAAWRYGRQLALPWREVLVPAALASGIGAFFGAAAVTERWDLAERFMEKKDWPKVVEHLTALIESDSGYGGRERYVRLANAAVQSKDPALLDKAKVGDKVYITRGKQVGLGDALVN